MKKLNGNMSTRKICWAMNRAAADIVCESSADEDAAWWSRRTPDERFQHIEHLRQMNYGYDPSTSRLREFLKLLNAVRVEYLLIGGYAVGFYGYSRSTLDMGIWIALKPGNANKMLMVMSRFGFPADAVDISAFLDKSRILRLGLPPSRAA